MSEENEKSESEESEVLAQRLGERFEKKKEEGEDVSRLGERFLKREEDTSEEPLDTSEVSSKEMEAEAKDFFNEIVGISENHPELENIKISELKKILAEIGMEHPEEVIKKLKKENKSIERREIKEEYTTY